MPDPSFGPHSKSAQLTKHWQRFGSRVYGGSWQGFLLPPFLPNSASFGPGQVPKMGEVGLEQISAHFLFIIPHNLSVHYLFILLSPWHSIITNQNYLCLLLHDLSPLVLWLLFSRSAVSDFLRSHGLQHARLHCPSPSPGVCSNSRPLSQ